jgi:hypothetical protein
VLNNCSVDSYFNPTAFSEPNAAASVTGAPIQEFGNSARGVAADLDRTTFFKSTLSIIKPTDDER